MQCQNCTTEFAIGQEDYDFYKKIDVPPPTWCPECRMVRRMSFRNEHHLFRNVDGLTGKEVFSSFPKSSPVVIYDHPYWWSDAWNPLDFGWEYDFGKPFFQQFKEFAARVPRSSRSIIRLVNSDYSDQAADLKNCYLCFNGAGGENSLYGVTFLSVRESVDFFQSGNLELCGEVSLAGRCYQTFFTDDSEDCRDVAFCVRCSDCTDCFGCVNLRHKKYHIFNVPYTKEEYEQELKKFDCGSCRMVADTRRKMESFAKQFPVKFSHATHNTHVIGEYVYRSKNALYCYEGVGLENVKYSQSLIVGASDSYDFTNWGGATQLVYESVTCGEECNSLKFCIECWPGCSKLEYCIECHSCSDCFACIGLRNKQYCIFNRQYGKEEYATTVAKIKEQMRTMPHIDFRGRSYAYGEFFPSELSPFAYNETMALELHPLTKEEAIAGGFRWQDPDTKEFTITISAEKLPDHIRDVPDTILHEVIACETCKKAYRIVPAELEFYRRFNLALPRRCFPCRHAARAARRNLPRWFRRDCMCEGSGSGSYKNNTAHSHGSERCRVSCDTSYPPGDERIVYCEDCYQAETA